MLKLPRDEYVRGSSPNRSPHRWLVHSWNGTENPSSGIELIGARHGEVTVSAEPGEVPGGERRSPLVASRRAFMDSPSAQGQDVEPALQAGTLPANRLPPNDSRALFSVPRQRRWTSRAAR